MPVGPVSRSQRLALPDAGLMGVVPLREGGLIPAVVAKPDRELIDRLKQLLADARSGQVRAMGYVMVDRDRGIGTGWVGHADHHDMTAGVNMLAHRYMQAAREDD